MARNVRQFIWKIAETPGMKSIVRVLTHRPTICHLFEHPLADSLWIADLESASDSHGCEPLKTISNLTL